MARGSDILFNPPKITKITKRYGQGKHLCVRGPGELPFLPQTLFAGQEGPLAMSFADDGIHENAPLLSLPSGHLIDDLPKRSGFFSLGESSLAFLDEDSFFILHLASGSQRAHSFLSPGDLLGFHWGQDEASFIWQEPSTGKTYCSSLVEDADRIMIPGKHHLLSGDVSVESKDNSSIVFLSPSKENEVASLLTIRDDGLGEAYPLDHHANREIGSRSRYEGEHHVCPGTKDGTYFYFDREEGSLCYLDLTSDDNYIITHDVDLTEDGQIGQVHALRSSQDMVLLLSSGRLALFSPEGMLDQMALSNDYQKLSFVGQRAVLWSEDKKSYLELEVT